MMLFTGMLDLDKQGFLSPRGMTTGSYQNSVQLFIQDTVIYTRYRG